MTISAVLLAGGESRRMGQDKATAFFRGAPLWQLQLERLRNIQPCELFVSARTDPSWRPANVEFVADHQPSRGALSGIAATLLRAASDHLLVLAVDMPFMTENYLRNLCQRIEIDVGVVPMAASRAEPLAAIYPSSVVSEFSEALSGTDFSLQPVIRKLISLRKLRGVRISDAEKPLFRNINELSDLDQA